MLPRCGRHAALGLVCSGVLLLVYTLTGGAVESEGVAGVARDRGERGALGVAPRTPAAAAAPCAPAAPCPPAAAPCAPPAPCPAAAPCPPAPAPCPPAPAPCAPAPAAAPPPRGIAGAEYAISSLFRVGNVAPSRNWGAGEVSPMATAFHGGWNAIVDAGPFDGTDFTLPAYRAGYSVFAFELSPANHAQTVRSLVKAGLAEGVDFSIVRPAPPYAPPPRAAKAPHVYLFAAGVSNASRPIALRYNAVMQGAGEGIEVAPGGCGAEAPATTCWAGSVVALDDVLPAWATLWMLKLDVQGHEPFALAGAARTLASGRVNTLHMEWWPTGIVAQGVPDGGVAALGALYDLGAMCFDTGHTVGNAMPGLGADRPSGLRAWTDAFLAVPHTPPPGGDPIGAWDDLWCQMPTLPVSNDWLSPADRAHRMSRAAAAEATDAAAAAAAAVVAAPAAAAPSAVAPLGAALP